MRDAAGPLALIAGRGRLPLEVARAARRQGRRVEAIGFPGETEPALEAEVERLTWLHLGEIGALLRTLQMAGAREAVMAGKVPSQGRPVAGSRAETVSAPKLATYSVLPDGSRTTLDGPRSTRKPSTSVRVAVSITSTRLSP